MYIVHLCGDHVTTGDIQDENTSRRNSTRGKVRAWTEKSASRFRDYLAGCLSDYTVLLTLTYPSWCPNGHNYDVAKSDLCRFFQRYRRVAPPAASAAWCMEFTSANVIHFHVLLNHWLDWGWVARAWYEVCGTEDERHLRAGTKIERLRSPDAGSAYMAKYMSKGALGRMTASSGGYSGRWWGVVGSRTELEASLRVKGGGEKAAEVREMVKQAVEMVLGDWVAAGKANEVDLSGSDNVPSTFRMWVIPSRAVRKIFCSLLMNWKFTAGYALSGCLELYEDRVFVDDPTGFNGGEGSI